MSVTLERRAPTLRAAAAVRTREAKASLQLAAGDVQAAFEAFLAQRPDPARPFVVVAHSQGAILMAKARAIERDDGIWHLSSGSPPPMNALRASPLDRAARRDDAAHVLRIASPHAARAAAIAHGRRLAQSAIGTNRVFAVVAIAEVLARCVEPRPAVRRAFVAAYLAGGYVPLDLFGALGSGAPFEHLRPMASPADVGVIASWDTRTHESVPSTLQTGAIALFPNFMYGRCDDDATTKSAAFAAMRNVRGSWTARPVLASVHTAQRRHDTRLDRLIASAVARARAMSRAAAAAAVFAVACRRRLARAACSHSSRRRLYLLHKRFWLLFDKYCARDTCAVDDDACKPRLEISPLTWSAAAGGGDGGHLGVKRSGATTPALESPPGYGDATKVVGERASGRARVGVASVMREVPDSVDAAIGRIRPPASFSTPR